MDDHGPSANVRAFVAIPVPPPLIDTLQKIQATLQTRLRSNTVRWSRPEQLHLTLRFLGNIRAAGVGGLIGVIRRVCESATPFRLSLAGRGCFPTARNPRVIWIGVEGDLEELRQLQRRTEAATADFGDPPEEKEFHPHLTIGRVKADPPQARQVGEAIEKIAVGKLGEWSVQEIDLMQSELRPGGARYSRLAAFVLAR
jgi:2'-5' RNA ligase